MSFIKVNVTYKKYKGLKLIERIKFDSTSEFFYFKVSDSFICKHVEILQKVYDFKKFSNVSKTLYHEDYVNYIDSNYKFLFNGNYLKNERDREDHLFSSTNVEILENHISCEICTKSAVKKEIRKRPKLSVEELCEISYDLGSKYKDTKIQGNYSLSKKSLLKFKNKLKNNLQIKKKKRSNLSLSLYDQNRILKLVNSNPIEYNSANKIKTSLRLDCHPDTIRNLLKRKNFKLHTLRETPYLNPLNKALKDKFCNLTKDLSPQDWKSVVFTDEKIIQNYNNSAYKGYRLRFNKKAGRGFDKRYEHFHSYHFSYLIKFISFQIFVSKRKTSALQT